MIGNSVMFFLTKLSLPIQGFPFVFFFLLNLISNSSYLCIDGSLYAGLIILCLSAFIAYVETILLLVLKYRWLKILYVTLIVTIQFTLAITDYYLLVCFNTVINQGTVGILAETNSLEISNFLKTYQSSLLGSILLGGALFWIVLVLSKKISLYRYQKIAAFLVCAGSFITLFCCYGYARYKSGMNIPQYTSLTRGVHSLFMIKKEMNDIKLLLDICKNQDVILDSIRKPTIVVIIGESFSVYHSSLYGYEKETNPLLSKRFYDGSLIFFDNAVSTNDVTSKVMKAVFSLDSMGVDYTSKALFPAIFKASNYYTALYDNQYLVNEGISILSDKELSDVMFDKRNEKFYQYDGQMVDDILVPDSMSLIIIHLMGQHFAYDKRYPPKFAKYNSNDYDSKYGEVVAHYDNATIYNDFVVNQIIERFKNTYSCVLYFSDHGEEVYELRDFNGHCSAVYSPNLNYQIRVPMFLWFSPSYLAENQDLVKLIRTRCHAPICSDDIGHVLLDLAGIKTKDFVPTRSFVNDRFDSKRHRIVLNSIDYDDYWVKHQ